MADNFFSIVQEIVANVACPPYELETYTVTGVDPDEAVAIQASLYRLDVATGIWGWGRGGLHFVTVGASVDDIIKRCLVACRDYAEHEVREAFTYQGIRVFDPHMPIAALVEAAIKVDAAHSGRSV